MQPTRMTLEQLVTKLILTEGGENPPFFLSEKRRNGEIMGYLEKLDEISLKLDKLLEIGDALISVGLVIKKADCLKCEGTGKILFSSEKWGDCKAGKCPDCKGKGKDW